MNVDVKQEKGIVVVKPLDKNLEASNSRDFKGQVINLIDQGNKAIVLDFSQIGFMDSSGLGSLISILKSLANSQGKLAICGLQDPVMKVFQLTRLNQAFQIFPNEEDALNSL